MKLGKNGKTAIGIFQDGLSIKVTQLSIINGKISLTELKETMLSLPLYPQEDVTPDLESQYSTDEEEQILPDLAQLEKEIKIPDLTELEETDLDAESDIDREEEIVTGKQEFQKLISQFPLSDSKLALNSLEENTSYNQFDETFAKSRSRSSIKKQLREEILTKEDRTKKNTYDFIRNPDNSILAFVQRGNNEILQALQEINPLVSKKRFFYSFIEPIEISLMNLIRNNYDFSDEEYILIIYIGLETKVGIVMKGKDYIKHFPIIVPEADIEYLRQAIYSKIILEQDTSNINITSNIIFAGEMTSDEDIAFFKQKINSDSKIDRITLDNLHIPQAKSERFTPEKISEFCIPIALAWKALEPRNKNFYSCSLLPDKIIESQKPFKIAWHGFIILAAIFYVAFSGTLKNLKIKEDMIELGRQNNAIEIELKRNRAIVVKLRQVKNEIATLEENIKKVGNLVDRKNQWYYILNVISNSFKDNKISWLTSFTSQDKTFKISGFTTRKRNVVPFSNLFPNGQIEKVIENTIQNVPIWQYDITYGYPNPLDIENQKKESEPGIEFIKDKEKLIPPQIQMDNFKPQPQTVQKDRETIIQSSNPKSRYQDITQFYFSGQYKQAFDQFKEFIEEFPENDLVYSAQYLMGECFYQIKDYNQAIQIFEKIIAQGGFKTPDALMMLGNTLLQQGEIEKAIVYWNRIITQYPNNRLTPIARSKVKQFSQAEVEDKVKEQALENSSPDQNVRYELQLYADTNYDAVLNEQNILESLGYTTKILPINIEGRTIYRLRLDEKFSKEQAATVGKKINTQTNRYADYWIAETLIKNPGQNEDNTKNSKPQDEYSQIVDKYFAKEYQQAYELFSLFIKKHPTSELVHNAKYLMGEAKYQLGNYDESITIFKDVVQDNSRKTPDALMMLGNANEKMENNDKALYYWNELISRFPQSKLADIAQFKAINLKD